MSLPMNCPMKVLINTDIVIDILTKREGPYAESYAVLRLAAEDQVDAFVTASNIANIYRTIHESGKDSRSSRNAIIELLQVITARDTTAADILAALSSTTAGFEAAITAAVAKREKADCIVTRNADGFVASPVPTISPAEFLAAIPRQQSSHEDDAADEGPHRQDIGPDEEPDTSEGRISGADEGPDKPLSGMPLEKLWGLFPIELRPYSPQYPRQYAATEAALRGLLGRRVFRISHIGSTAIESLLSKPIIDILMEVDVGRSPHSVIHSLEAAGWLLMAESHGSQEGFRLDFNKGYTPQGFASEVFHLHVVLPGDPDELYFRDYLGDHPHARTEYEALKRSLLPKFKHDRDDYTEAKTAFVRETTARARAKYLDRYRCDLTKP